MIEQNSEKHKQIQELTSYTQFIANQFNIKIILDTNESKVDTKNRAIFLPSMEIYSEDELNATYAILLHEAGHIRHSNFTKEYFQNFSTQLQLYFAGCFEDARIENLLCKDFDGARNIFEKLYQTHVHNEIILPRIFGFKSEFSKVENTFGAFLHNLKADFNTDDVFTFLPNAKLLAFLNKEIATLQEMQNHPLKTMNDSVELGKIAYKLFTKSFKDAHPEISFEKDEAIVNKMKNAISTANDALQTKMTELEAKVELTKQANHAYNEIYEKVADEYEDLKNQVNGSENFALAQRQFNKAHNSASKDYSQIQSKTLTNLKNANNHEKLLQNLERRFNALANLQKNIQEENKVNPSLSLEEMKNMFEQGKFPLPFSINSFQDSMFDPIRQNIEKELQRIDNLKATFDKKDNAIKNRNSAINALEKSIKDSANDMKKALGNALKSLPNVPVEMQQASRNSISEMREAIKFFDENDKNTILEALDQIIQQNAESTESTEEDLENGYVEEDEQGQSMQGEQGQSMQGEQGQSMQGEQGQSMQGEQGQSMQGEQGQSMQGEQGQSMQGEQGQSMQGDADAAANGDDGSNAESSFGNKMNAIKQQLKAIEDMLSPAKENLKNARNAEKQLRNTIDSEMFKFLNQSTSSSSSGKNSHQSQLPMMNIGDIFFEKTPGWQAADDYQKEFDNYASDELQSFVVNGAKLAGSGSGSRNLQVLFDKMKNHVEEIDISSFFQQNLSGSMMDQGNNFGNQGFGQSLGNTVNAESYIAKFAKTSAHTVLTTEFDNIEMMNTAKKNSSDIQRLFTERPLIVKRINEEIKKKMKFTKKPRFVGAKDEGDLDSRNLWKIPARRGSDVFEQNNPKFVNNVAASILVDVSGSLNNDATKEGNELKFLAAALSDALQNSYVNHEVLGHHAPYNPELAALQSSEVFNRRNHSLETIVFKNFKQKDFSGIENLEIQSSDNSDGESLRIAIKRLSQQKARNRILFMITDAKPFLSGSDTVRLDKDLYDALNEAKRKKIQVVGISFNSDKNGIFGKNFVHITDHSYEDLIDSLKNLDIKSI